MVGKSVYMISNFLSLFRLVLCPESGRVRKDCTPSSLARLDPWIGSVTGTQSPWLRSLFSTDGETQSTQIGVWIVVGPTQSDPVSQALVILMK